MSKGSILVVDDESEIREGLELLLKYRGLSGVQRRNRGVRTVASRRTSV